MNAVSELHRKKKSTYKQKDSLNWRVGSLKSLPNILSVSRFALAVSLFFFEPFSAMFIAIYAVAVLTDAVDGTLARQLDAQTKIGDGLDTFADFALVGIVLIRIAPSMSLDALPIVIIISIFALKGFALLVPYIKFKQVISLTTYFGKLLAVMGFMFPLLYWSVKYAFPQLYGRGITENTLIIFMGTIGILIMLEELLIHLVSPVPRPNARGFLFDRINHHLKVGEVMATYKQIQDYVKEIYGYTPRTTWIAHMKEICGLNPKMAATRRSPIKRVNPCPPDRQDDLRKAFIYFKML